MGQREILEVLKTKEYMTYNDIARELNQHKTTVYHSLKRLKRKGLIDCLDGLYEKKFRKKGV